MDKDKIDTSPPKGWRRLKLDRGWNPTWAYRVGDDQYELELLPRAHVNRGEYPWRLRRVPIDNGTPKLDWAVDIGRFPSAKAAIAGTPELRGRKNNPSESDLVRRLKF